MHKLHRKGTPVFQVTIVNNDTNDELFAMMANTFIKAQQKAVKQVNDAKYQHIYADINTYAIIEEVN